MSGNRWQRRGVLFIKKKIQPNLIEEVCYECQKNKSRKKKRRQQINLFQKSLFSSAWGNKQKTLKSAKCCWWQKGSSRTIWGTLVSLMDNCSGLAFGKQPRAGTHGGPIIFANTSSLGIPHHASMPRGQTRGFPKRVVRGAYPSPSA